jgi:two-component system sensor histidine kinase RegB
MNVFSTQTGHHHLRRLATLRGIAIGAQVAALALAWFVLGMPLPWLPLVATVAAEVIFALLAWVRLGSARPVSNPELFLQLCLDVLALAVLLYFSGGSTNPFISLFLLPLVIAAATLPRGYTWGMAALATACYTLLMKYYVPLPHPMPGGMEHAREMEHDMGGMAGMPGMSGMSGDSIFNLHVIGMWLGFVLSAVIIAWFVVRMAHAVRERDAALARAREDTLRNERIIALGTLAASAAHELGTPLSTMAVVIGELGHDTDLPQDWQDSLALLDGQVRNCRRILDKMLDDTQAAKQPLDAFIAETLDEWRLLRPATTCEYQAGDLRDAELASFDNALRPALLNLLNNAADASPERIEVIARIETAAGREGRELVLTINDHGPGLTPEAAERAGSAFFTTKQEGRGLGLFLANATLERMGSKVRLFNREGGGATTVVTLPIRTAAS